MGNVKRNKRTHLDRDTTGSCFYPQHSQNPSFLYFFSFLFSTQPLAQIALNQLGVGLVAPRGPSAYLVPVPQPSDYNKWRFFIFRRKIRPFPDKPFDSLSIYYIRSAGVIPGTLY